MGAYGSPELSPNDGKKESNNNLHSFVTCKKCGFTYSDYYSSCPKCNSRQYNNVFMLKKRNSFLGVFALLFSFLFFPMGLILGIIDIFISKNNKHILSIIAIIISFVFLIVSLKIGYKNAQKEQTHSANSISSSQNIQTPNNPINTERKIEFNSSYDAFGINTVFSSVYISQGTKANTPPEGYVFYICEFDIGNNTQSYLQINSAKNFSAYADKYLCNNVHLMFDAENNHSYIDCNIAPGKRNKGVVVFQVPKEYQNMEIRYKPYLTSQAEFIFTSASVH